MLGCSINLIAQVDFNKRPDDDLGNVEDAFQESFFEAIKEQGIENYQKSINALLRCKQIDNSKAVVFYELGKNYNQLKNFGAAEEALKEAVEMEPGNEWYLDELYHVYLQQNDMNSAVKTVRQLVKYHPDYKQDLVSLYIQAEKYKDAMELLDELDAKFGISTDRDYLRNQIYNLTGKDKDRIENLEERLKSDPENEINYLNLIYRYSEMEKPDKAFETAKQLLKVKPQSQLVHLALYKFYLDNGETAEAVKSMKIVLSSSEIKPDAKTKVLNDFVKFVGENPEFESELLEVTAGLDANPDAKTNRQMAMYYLQAKNKPKALEYFQLALNEQPKDLDLLKNIVLLQIDLSNFSEAEKISQNALDLYPAQPVLYLLNGVAHNGLKNGKKAAETLEMGLTYLIDDKAMERDFYKQLSVAYSLQNNTSKSQWYFKQAEALKNAN